MRLPMTDSSSATSLPLPSALYWSALGRWGVLIGDVEDELAALSWRLEADELVERAPRGKYSTLTEPPERLTRIDVGLPTPSPQRVRLNPHRGPIRFTAACNDNEPSCSRASATIRSVRSRSSSGYFRGADRNPPSRGIRPSTKAGAVQFTLPLPPRVGVGASVPNRRRSSRRSRTT